MTYPPTPAGELQYFQPPGPALPTRRWQRRSRPWIWTISVIVGLLLLGLGGYALVRGTLEQQYFTATGAVQTDCRSGRAVSGADLGVGDPVRLYAADDGRELGSTTLDERLTAEGSSQVCFAAFTLDDIYDVDGGYLLEIGGEPGRLISRAALEAGLVLDS